MSAINRARLEQLIASEAELFRLSHPRSLQLFEQAQQSLLGGVPMSWMMKWAGGFPLFFKEAHGSRLTDADGHEYIDFCLGDTGAMPGHSPIATAQAIARQAANGITTMLPTEDAIWVGQELQRRALAMSGHPSTPRSRPKWLSLTTLLRLKRHWRMAMLPAY